MSDKTVYSRRNPAIDMLRALTMFTMIFVNDFWKVHDVPHWLEHAVYGEDFMGLADIVFPCFLFAVGMSIPYAIERRYAKGFSAESTLGHILSRTFALLVMGAFITNSEFRLSPEAPYPIGVYWFLMAIGFIGVWNQYPKPASGTQKNLFRAFKIIGVLVLLYLAFTFRNPQGGVFGAYWGILGSIGWTYLVVAVTNSPKHDLNRCKSVIYKFLSRDQKSARDKNGTKPRKNKVKNTSPEISLVEYLLFRLQRYKFVP